MFYIFGPVHSQLDALDHTIIILGFGRTLGCFSGCELHKSTALSRHNFDGPDFPVVVEHISQISFRDAVRESANPQSRDALVLGCLQAGALLGAVEHLDGHGVVDAIISVFGFLV